MSIGLVWLGVKTFLGKVSLKVWLIVGAVVGAVTIVYLALAGAENKGKIKEQMKAQKAHLKAIEEARNAELDTAHSARAERLRKQFNRD